MADQTVILPVLARDEESQATTQESMFNLVRLSDGGTERFSGARSEVDVVCDLGEQILGSHPAVDWSKMRTHSEIRSWISKVIPGWKNIASIDRTKEEFQIDGRTFHRPRFPTPDGKAILHTHQLPELKGDSDCFRLMTVRSEGQFNTVVYEEEDLYRGIDRRDVILMHPDDADRTHLDEDEIVTVESDTGSLEDIHVRRFDDIKPGNVLMYYPEANVLGFPF